MPGNESRLAEYNELRAELLQLSQSRLSVTTFAITATVALLGFGVQSDKHQSLIMLAPLMVLVLAAIQMITQAFSTMRVATYIRLQIESADEQLNWETYMRQYRAEVRAQPDLRRLSWPSYEVVLVAAGLICAALSIVFAESAWLTVLSAAMAVLWLLFSVWFVLTMGRATSGDLERELEDMDARIAQAVDSKRQEVDS